MSYLQVKSFNQSQGGTQAGWCLANVVAGFNIPNKYGSAWEAWQHTQQHGDNPPLGLDVPVYFSYSATIDGEYKNWGHIGVRLANGQFWSDGKLYSSISAYTANHSPIYVGWGESVNDVAVIKQGENMSGIITKDQEQALSRLATGSNPGSAYDYRFTGKECAQYNIDALITFWGGYAQVNTLKTQIAQKDKELLALKASIGDVEVNALGSALLKMLQTLGYKKV